MTVTVEESSAGPFFPNGVTVSFDFEFKVASATEVEVIRLDPATGISSTVSSTLYTVTLAADGEGGRVTFAAAPTDVLGDLYILSVPDFVQQTVFSNNGFLGSALNSPFDRSVVRDLYLLRLLQSTVRVGPGVDGFVIPRSSSGELLGTLNGGLELVDAGDFQGAPGGNVMATGAFTALDMMEIDEGTTRIWTSEHHPGTGIGGASYVADVTVDAAYVVAHPTLTALSADGRGWRIAERVIDITQAGILPGDVAGRAEANSTAVEALMAYLLANVPTSVGGTSAIKVTAPANHFRYSEAWAVKCALFLEGQSNSQRNGYATFFDFDKGGFEFHAAWTDHDGQVSPATTGASGWRLENIACSSRAAAGTGYHGLHAVTRGDVIRCTFNAFPGDGIRIESVTGFGSSSILNPNNANSTRILFCQCGGNGGHGIHLLNGDANVVTTQACDLHSNGGFGIFDNAFLSNHHIGHHAEANGLAEVYPEHKISGNGSSCTTAVPAWASAATYAVKNPEGQYRMNAGKLYLLLKAGGGATANAPTHTNADGVTEADGYRWAYGGTTPYLRWHTTVDGLASASTTAPGTDITVWVPYEFANSVYVGMPLWVSGMTWGNGGSYCGNSSAGLTVWEACYGELSQPLAQIRSPQVWVGGQAAVSQSSTCVQVNSYFGALTNPYGFRAEKRRYNGEMHTATFGATMGSGGWLAVGHPTRHPDYFYANQDVDTTFELGSSGAFMTFAGTDTAFTGGRSAGQPGAVNIPKLFVGSGSNARSVDWGSAAPASGPHAAGDVVYNIAPTAGGSMGWMCITAGDPGTWKAMPNLAA